MKHNVMETFYMVRNFEKEPTTDGSRHPFQPLCILVTAMPPQRSVTDFAMCFYAYRNPTKIGTL